MIVFFRIGYRGLHEINRALEQCFCFHYSDFFRWITVQLRFLTAIPCP
jgi:hypothetical protein